jgi:IMP dehydrogenase/GMP reductase
LERRGEGATVVEGDVAVDIKVTTDITFAGPIISAIAWINY